MKNFIIKTKNCSQEEFDFLKAYLTEESWDFKLFTDTQGSKDQLVEKISDLKVLINEKDTRIARLISGSKEKKTAYKSKEDQRNEKEVARLNAKVFDLQVKEKEIETYVESNTNLEAQVANLQEMYNSISKDLEEAAKTNKALVKSLIEVSKLTV